MQFNKLRDLHTLIALFEKSNDLILSTSGERIRGIPAWVIHNIFGLNDIKKWSEYLIKVGYAAVYPSYRDYEPLLVPIEEVPNNQIKYKNLDTLEWHMVCREETAIYRVNTIRYLSLLATRLKLDHVYDPFLEILCKVAWKVGITYQPDPVDVYVTRDLSIRIDEIRYQFLNRPGKNILLSCEEVLDEKMFFPENTKVLLAKDLFVRDENDNAAKLDWPNFGWHSGWEGSTCGPIRYDEVRNVLSIEGKPDWYIRGPRKQAAIKFMVEQFQKGNNLIQAKDILAASRPRGYEGGSKRVSSLFKDCSWEDYIQSPKKGFYKFIID